MGVSVVDSIKLGRVLVGEMSCCGITGCLSCRGKQSTSSLLFLLSSSGHRADCLVPVRFGVRLRGACVGLCMCDGWEGKRIPWLLL